MLSLRAVGTLLKNLHVINLFHYILWFTYARQLTHFAQQDFRAYICEIILRQANSLIFLAILLRVAL